MKRFRASADGVNQAFRFIETKIHFQAAPETILV